MNNSLLNSLHIVLNQKLFASKISNKCDQECQTDTLTIPLLCHIKTPLKLEYPIDIDNEESSKGCQTDIVKEPIFANQSVKRKEEICQLTIPSKRICIPSTKAIIVYHPFIDDTKGKVNRNHLRNLRMTSVIDAFEEAGIIEGLNLHELQKKYACEFDEDPMALSGICKLLRSKQFGISRDNKVIKFKRNM